MKEFILAINYFNVQDVKNSFINQATVINMKKFIHSVGKNKYVGVTNLFYDIPNITSRKILSSMNMAKVIVNFKTRSFPHFIFQVTACESRGKRFGN